MATARYSRIDNSRGSAAASSSGYWSKVTVFVFVALCLVGVWMLTSSSVVPVDNTDLSREEGKIEAKDGGVSESKVGSSGQYENNSDDQPDDVTKGELSLGKNESGAEDDQKSRDKVTGEGGDGEKRKDGNEFKTEDGEQKSGEGDSGGDSEKAAADKKSFSDTSDSKSELDEGEKKSDASDSDSKSDSDDGKNKSDSEDGEKKSNSEDGEKGSESDEKEKKSENNSGETKTGDKKDEKVDQVDETGIKSDQKNESSSEDFPSGLQSELQNETTAKNGSFSTQATESKNEKESLESAQTHANFSWKLCNVTAGPDFIPCLDNLDAIRHLKTTMHYEHRERHCPENPPTCLVPLPEGYKKPIRWPKSREKIWYSNVPHTKLAAIKGHQNWVKVTGDYLTFPGGGTQFTHGALHYIDTIQESLSDIAWGNRSRVVLDVGCGVASFGGYLFERDVLTMSFAPKDEHEAQVQFALERGIPAISAVMGTTRLPFPGRVFDIVHCARCRVPWHVEGGKLLLELNRVLRPGGFFVWSATPVYRKNPEDSGIWDAMKKLTKDMCWETLSITKDSVNRVGIAIYKKPTSNECYKKRSQNEPPLCSDSDNPNAAWNVSLQACMHKAPVDPKERGSKWPEQWPARLGSTPFWLQSSQTGVYGKPAPDDFVADYEHWKHVVSKTYLNEMGFNWSSVRNVMDMRAVYGGFAAALKDLNIWVMNVVAIDSADTLPVIYERGLFGIYHDWCESFSTYPRSYDLLHADHLFSRIRKRCSLASLVAEVDRILRPDGKLIVRDDVETLTELKSMVKYMQWDVLVTFSNEEGLLCVQKSMWRPKDSETLVYAIA